MSTGTIIKFSLLGTIAVFYLIYTIQYSKEFKKNKLFSKPVKIFHFIMIWTFPFAWIIFLKNLTKAVPGSFELKEKTEPAPFSNPHDIPSD